MSSRLIRFIFFSIMGPLDTYKEDYQQALPGVCKVDPQIVHDNIYLWSNEEDRKCCPCCHLPYHSAVVNKCKSDEQRKGFTNLSSPQLAASSPTHRPATLPTNPPPATLPANLPPSALPGTYHSSGTLLTGRNQPGNSFQYTQPRSNPTSNRQGEYGPNTKGSDTLANVDDACKQIINGWNDAKREYAKREAARKSTYDRKEDAVILRINTYACEYYIDGAGAEAAFVATQQIKHWQTDVIVPSFKQDTLLQDWLTTDIIPQYQPNQQATFRESQHIKFAQEIRSVGRHHTIKVMVDIAGYDTMTVGNLLRESENPWQRMNAHTKSNMFKAFVIMYRQKVNPPIRVQLRAEQQHASAATPSPQAAPENDPGNPFLDLPYDDGEPMHIFSETPSDICTASRDETSRPLTQQLSKTAAELTTRTANLVAQRCIDLTVESPDMNNEFSNPVTLATGGRQLLGFPLDSGTNELEGDNSRCPTQQEGQFANTPVNTSTPSNTAPTVSTDEVILPGTNQSLTKHTISTTSHHPPKHKANITKRKASQSSIDPVDLVSEGGPMTRRKARDFQEGGAITNEEPSNRLRRSRRASASQTTREPPVPKYNTRKPTKSLTHKD
ncbi:hypothetical protein F4776DRAFT_631182 [Hypoxylon sp. NC0597]|nr:hypothetical protein F4776DRAFT_631182 [Hypoxylon sp. NC0597]